MKWFVIIHNYRYEQTIDSVYDTKQEAEDRCKVINELFSGENSLSKAFVIGRKQ